MQPNERIQANYVGIPFWGWHTVSVLKRTTFWNLRRTESRNVEHDREKEDVWSPCMGTPVHLPQFPWFTRGHFKQMLCRRGGKVAHGPLGREGKQTVQLLLLALCFKGTRCCREMLLFGAAAASFSSPSSCLPIQECFSNFRAKPALLHTSKVHSTLILQLCMQKKNSSNPISPTHQPRACNAANRAWTTCYESARDQTAQESCRPTDPQ